MFFILSLLSSYLVWLPIGLEVVTAISPDHNDQTPYHNFIRNGKRNKSLKPYKPRADVSFTLEGKSKNRQMQTSFYQLPKPKMNGKVVAPGDLSAFTEKMNDHVTEHLSSQVSYVIGECSLGKAFKFPIGGKSGRGVIGVQSASVLTSIDFASPNIEEGTIVMEGNSINTNFFALPELNNFDGIKFGYQGRKTVAISSVQVKCSNKQPIDIIVIVRDDGRETVNAEAVHLPGSGNLRVTLVNKSDSSSRSCSNLRAEPILTIDKKQSPSGKRLFQSSFVEGSYNDIFLKENKTRDQQSNHTISADDTECSFVQIILSNSDNIQIPKTLIVCDEKIIRNRARKLHSNTIKLNSTDIDENGDIVLKFESIANDKLENSIIRFDARIGIISECMDGNINIVDMNAMVSSLEPTLVVNGGWFRREIHLHGISNCSWEPVVIDAIATDPKARYTHIRYLYSPITATVMKGNRVNRNHGFKIVNDRRNLLKEFPSQDEININDAMTQGRKPENILPSHSSDRNLAPTGLHKKILIHGYCANENPFPLSHFTEAVAFSDPDTPNPVASSWNLDEFARKIDKFAVINGIDSCGIIAHSQGGMAALHLYKSYWSCLDYASNVERSIQSVGSPYQGSPLAGNLAALGNVFGYGCGYNADLSVSGATNWLAGIPSWARKKVYFYTTSNYDKWFSYDYCHFVTDLILSDPDDGAIEKERGQLPGGNNAGHTTGQCHTGGMDDPSQTEDKTRNSFMNEQAAY